MLRRAPVRRAHLRRGQNLHLSLLRALGGNAKPIHGPVLKLTPHRSFADASARVFSPCATVLMRCSLCASPHSPHSPSSSPCCRFQLPALRRPRRAVPCRRAVGWTRTLAIASGG